jgi:hypothetical protein
MTRRRLLLVVLPATLLFGVGVWLLWLRHGEPGITTENAYRVQKGMTLIEVEAILGGPERKEGDCGIRVLCFSDAGPPTWTWESDDVLIAVFCDSDNRVESTSVYSRGMRATIRSWLGL